MKLGYRLLRSRAKLRRKLFEILLGRTSLDFHLTDKQGRSIVAGSWDLAELPITFTMPGRRVYRLGALVITKSKRRRRYGTKES